MTKIVIRIKAIFCGTPSIMGFGISENGQHPVIRDPRTANTNQHSLKVQKVEKPNEHRSLLTQV